MKITIIDFPALRIFDNRISFYFGKPLDCMSSEGVRPVIREVLRLWKFLKRRKFLHIPISTYSEMRWDAGGRMRLPLRVLSRSWIYEPAAMPPRCATVSRRYL